MQTGDKFYCPWCGCEHILDEWDRFDFEEFGVFDTLCDGCHTLFRTINSEGGKPLVC